VTNQQLLHMSKVQRLHFKLVQLKENQK
jgi:hypothetical protein